MPRVRQPVAAAAVAEPAPKSNSSLSLAKTFLSLVFGGLMAGSLRSSSVSTSFFKTSDGLITRMASAIDLQQEGPLLRKSAATERMKTKNEYTTYVPSKIEDYILTHTKELGIDLKEPELVPTCQLWTDDKSTPYHKDMHDFVTELADYYKRIETFKLPDNITDIRKHLHNPEEMETMCHQLDLHQDGLTGLFPNQKLSFTRSGWVEPLLPPMRHPNWCIDGTQPSLASIEYLIHDFAHMCRRMKPSSRTVLFDMGASLMFSTKWPSPILQLVDIFSKFGLPFDHIYAYEKAHNEPSKVFEMVPESMSAAYHWINVGVDPDPESRNNPFKLLLDNYNEDDFVIVKLDIDTPEIEHKLAHQLLNDPRLLKIIDQFYFEHHVNQKELAPYWGVMSETVEDSLNLFQELRKRGVASHFWT